MFDDDVWRYSPIGPEVTVVFGTLGLIVMVYVARTTAPRGQLIARGLLAVVVLAILAVTWRGYGFGYGGFNWQLGASIRAELGNINRELGMLNVFGNVAMFVPVGWLVAILANSRKLLVGTASAFLLSVVIEVVQMFTGGAADIDDIVLNTFGGMLGATLVALLLRRPLPRGFASYSGESAGPEAAP